jgi:hypothetical protein
MKALSRVRVAVALLVVFGSAAHAADAPPSAPAVAPVPARSPAPVEAPATKETTKEPVVQRTVIDDGRAVIEELRVRGRLVKVTVHPKDGSPDYEIIVGDGLRELPPEGRNSRGASGQRVWNVLTF